MPEFYSQFGQDRAVRELMPSDRGRCYIDVGAGDGRTDSNTLHFEESGWKGLCIEADSEVFKVLSQNGRRHNGLTTLENVAIANRRDDKVQFRRVPVPGWSGLVDFPHELNAAAMSELEAEIITVECYPLRWFIEFNSVVDYLSLDIEGAELSALESIDWQRTTIYVITVEINRTDGAIGQFLMERGYCLWARLGSDEVYVLRDWLLGGRR